MKYKYLYFFLIILSVLGITFADFYEKYQINQFFNKNSEACVIGKGCELSKIRPGFSVGDTIPNISLYPSEEKNVKLYDVIKNKKNIYLSIITDWCSDCKEELQQLANINQHINNETVVIPIFVVFNDEKTNITQIKNFIKTQNFPFVTYIDKNNTILQKFKINGTPTNIYINSKGRIKLIAQEQSLIDIIKLTYK